MSHSISPAMLKAYREAVFVIHSGREKIAFQVDKSNPEILAFLKNTNTTQAALITAYNPYSHASSKQENQKAQGQLTDELEKLGIEFIYGEGRDAQGLWEAEPSLLALNISIEKADALATMFKQNAYVLIAEIGPPILKLMFPISDATDTTPSNAG